LSYLFTAFLATHEPPSASEARDYLLEGALFDDDPEITIHSAADGAFERMELCYDAKRAPIALRRLRGEDAEAARAEAIDVASLGQRDDLAALLERAPLVLEWEVERTELDEDGWFAVHLWQAWILGRANGWLYAPNDGLFDARLQRVCAAA
jgi:hypothetical protein